MALRPSSACTLPFTPHNQLVRLIPLDPVGSREVKSFALDHTASTCQRQDANLSLKSLALKLHVTGDRMGFGERLTKEVAFEQTKPPHFYYGKAGFLANLPVRLLSYMGEFF